MESDPVTQRELQELRDHLRDLREADQRALSIKETADLAALSLAREHQQWRDAQANELRAQINQERGTYVSQAEFKPVLAYISAQQGRSAGVSALQATLIGLAGLAIAVLSVALAMGR
jgi:hypothetical protein